MIVRPDHCRCWPSPRTHKPINMSVYVDGEVLTETDISMITEIENHEAIGGFLWWIRTATIVTAKIMEWLP